MFHLSFRDFVQNISKLIFWSGMKHFGIDHIRNFPFVTQPDEKKLIAAERLLIKLGALEAFTGKQTRQKSKMNISGNITG